MISIRWPRVQFGDVVRQVKDKVDPLKSGLDRYVAGEHMDTDDLRLRRWGQINGDYLGPAFHMRFKPGHVLYGSRRTYLRKVAVADFEGICANTTFVLESRDPTVLLPELLPFIMQTEAFHDHSIKQSKGSVNPYVNFSDLAWYEFALPPLEEQRRIALVLDASTKNAEALENCHVAGERLLKGFILDEFVDATAKYKSITLVKAGEILMGRQKAPQFCRGISPRPFLKVVNIGDLELKLDIVEEMDFTDKELDKYALKPGDIVLTEGDLVSASNVGRPALFEGQIEDCCFQNTLIRFRASMKILPHYALLVFEGARLSGLLARVAKTTTVTHLGLGRFSEIHIPIPPLDVQAEAVTRFLALMESRSQLRNRILAHRQFHSGLVKEALS